MKTSRRFIWYCLSRTSRPSMPSRTESRASMIRDEADDESHGAQHLPGARSS